MDRGEQAAPNLLHGAQGQHVQSAAAPYVAGLTGVTSVRLHNVGVPAATAVLPALASLPALVSVALRDVDATTWDEIQQWTPAAHERHVHARMSALGVGLAACRALTHLTLEGQRFDINIAQECLMPQLSKMSALVQLKVEHVVLRALASTAMQHVARLRRLETLDLGCTLPWDSGLDALALDASKLTALQHLAITHDVAGLWTEQLSAACGALSRLTCLVISTSGSIEARGVDPVEGFTPELARLTRLVRLELSQVVDRYASASALAAAVSKLTQLQRLGLTRSTTAGIGAGTTGAQAMQGALGALPQLTFLELKAAFNMFGSGGAGVVSSRGRAPLPATPLGLCALELAGVGWPQHREDSLAEALVELTALTYLGMPALCPTGAASIVVPIQAVRSLTAILGLRHLYAYVHDPCIDRVNRLGEALASIMQITRLEFQPMANGSNIACIVPHIAKLTGLEHLS
jgi:hypothetical protein